MKNLIYFPYFEPSNEEWLKFSLLYMDEFRPIIPSNRGDNISSTYHEIIQETDLIKPYSPNYRNGENASIKSIEEINKYLSNPELYRSKFNNKNILKKWRKEHKRKYLIYQEKFSNEFERYCVENKLGTKIDEGLLIHKDIAYIFMINLANEISTELNSSIITDSKKFVNYANFKQSEVNLDNKTELAESVIRLNTLANIKDISYKQLIKFRNENIELIKSFNREISNFENNINEENSLLFLAEFENIYKELTNKIAQIGVGTILISLSIYSIIKNGSWLENSIEASTELIGAGMTFADIYKVTKNKKQCVKYFANLKNLY